MERFSPLAFLQVNLNQPFAFDVDPSSLFLVVVGLE
jgi:hypothetical protein